MIDLNRVGPTLIELLEHPGFQTEVAQLQAKALLTEVATELPHYNWNYIPRRITRNLSYANLSLDLLARTKPEGVSEWSSSARKVAMIWESLAGLNEGVTREIALANAAASYEIAGYQANAACIARRITADVNGSDSPNLLHLVTLFLQRRLLRLRPLANLLRSEPQETESGDAVVAHKLATALAATALLEFLRFLLRGDPSAIDDALRHLQDAERVFAGLPDIESANLVHTIGTLLPVIRPRTIWSALGESANGSPRWQRYLKLLARGVSQDVFNGRSIVELWPSQFEALSKGLLEDDRSKITRMPTSAGKTRLAELCIIHTLVESPGAKCVYVAPYRALVSELQQSLIALLSDLGLRVSSVIGTYEFDDFEERLITDTDVLVTTPEKLDLIFRTDAELVGNVKLFVLDETQLLDDMSRGAKFELLVSRLMTKFPTARFLTLSAVIPQETLEDFANWFNVSPSDDVITSSWRPSVQRFAKFNWAGNTGVIRYVRDPDIKAIDTFVPGVIRVREFDHIHPQTGRRRRPCRPEKSNKAQIAAELALKFADLGPVLVFCPQANFVRSVARALEDRLRLGRLTDGTTPRHFQRRENTRSVLLADEWAGEAMANWLRSGIGVHYGSLPDQLRTAIETDFRDRRLQVLIATNTLAQGVNLPVRTVIVHSCWRHVGDRQERIPARDYWNIAGRAGRAGEETEGLVIHIALNSRDESDFRYFIAHRDNVEPVQSALFRQLHALVEGRLSPEALQQQLDPELLGILAEETSTGVDPGDAISAVLDNTLVAVQAERQNQSMQQLKSVMTSGARTIVQNMRSAEEGRLFSATGLSSTSCVFIRDHVEHNEANIRTMLQTSKATDRRPIIDLMIPLLVALPELQPSRAFAGSFVELCERWLLGTSVSSLITEFEEDVDSPEEIGRFIDDLFRYKLPWGVSSYIQVATGTLEISRDSLSQFVRFLPSMIKFGLPDPIACWAMSAGVPFRQTAVALSSSYSDETDVITYESFVTWLAGVGNERLRHDFGLTSPLLEDVARGINGSTRNRILSEFTGAHDFLPHEVPVRGIGFEDRSRVARLIRPGAVVEITRDYDNLVDRNAIAVSYQGYAFGYLPWDVAQLLAVELDTGLDIAATVSSVKSGSPPSIEVRLEAVT